MNKIKVIAFDLGGVFFAEGKKIALEILSQKYGYDKKLVLDVLTSSKSEDLRKGLITDEEFWLWAKRQLPADYNTETIKKEWYDGYILDEDIFGLVKKLKNRYKLVVFSGNVKTKVEYLDEKYRFRQYFEKEIYSYDYHTTKNERKFFEILIKETKSDPEEILLIDDGDFSVAKELGINLVIYQRGKIKELEESLRDFGI